METQSSLSGCLQRTLAPVLKLPRVTVSAFITQSVPHTHSCSSLKQPPFPQREGQPPHHGHLREGVTLLQGWGRSWGLGVLPARSCPSHWSGTPRMEGARRQCRAPLRCHECGRSSRGCGWWLARKLSHARQLPFTWNRFLGRLFSLDPHSGQVPSGFSSWPLCHLFWGPWLPHQTTSGWAKSPLLSATPCDPGGAGEGPP